MASPSPQPIGPVEALRRRSVALRLARAVGFVGRVEYRHVYSQSGGAQYGRGAAAGSDLLTVYAEAFDREADPNDFSLSAIIAPRAGTPSGNPTPVAVGVSGFGQRGRGRSSGL